MVLIVGGKVIGRRYDSKSGGFRRAPVGTVDKKTGRVTYDPEGVQPKETLTEYKYRQAVDEYNKAKQEYEQQFVDAEKQGYIGLSTKEGEHFYKYEDKEVEEFKPAFTPKPFEQGFVEKQPTVLPGARYIDPVGTGMADARREDLEYQRQQQTIFSKLERSDKEIKDFVSPIGDIEGRATPRNVLAKTIAVPIQLGAAGGAIVESGAYLGKEYLLGRRSAKEIGGEALKQTPSAAKQTLKGYDPRTAEGFVNVGLLAVPVAVKSVGGVRSVKAVKPQLSTSEAPRIVPKTSGGYGGYPDFLKKTPKKTAQIVEVGSRYERLPASIKERLPPKPTKVTNPLEYKELTAKKTVVVRKASTPEQAAVLRQQNIESARKAFRDPRYGRDFRLDVLEEQVAASKAQRIILKKQSKGVIGTKDSTRLLSEKETAAFKERIKANKAAARRSEEIRASLEKSRENGYGGYRGFGKKGSINILEKPQLLEKPKTSFKIPATLVPSLGVLGTPQPRFSPSLVAPRSGFYPSQTPISSTQPSIDTKRLLKPSQVAGIALATGAIIGASSVIGRISATSPAQSQLQAQKSYEENFPRGYLNAPGGGLGGGSYNPTRRSRDAKKYLPSLTGVELGIKATKKQKAYKAFGGLELRGI